MVNPLLLASQIGEVSAPFTNFLLSNEQRKLDKENQRHRNAVLGISSNIQRNQTTLQEIDVRNANRRQNQNIQLTALQQQGAAEVSAAAAGVAGGSVQSVMRGLKRSALNAQYNRLENTENAFQSLGQQRRNINVSQILGTDNTVLPRPSFAAMLLGTATAAFDTFGGN